MSKSKYQIKLKAQNSKLMSLRAKAPACRQAGSNLAILKRSVAILILLVLSAFLVAPIAYAAEKEKLRVYYSEPIGAGEKVYHFTACNWVRAYEPLVCNDELAKEKIYKTQCVYKGGDKNGEVKKGTKIMGCVQQDAIGADAFEDPAKMYLKASVEDYDSKKCKDDPTLQGYKYAPTWAVINKNGQTEPYKWKIEGTFAWEPGETDIPESWIKEISKNATKKDAYKFFKTNLCATWDALLSSKKPDYENMNEDTATLLGDIFPENDDITGDLINKGCNNDNSKEALPIVTDGSASPIPLVHCSLVERITGETGTDVFSQYVGALYKWAVGIVGIVTVLIMVFSGIQISMAGGDSGKIDSAKNRIMQSIIGLVILFLAGLILYTINPGFFTG